ncbi:Peptidoglycan/LPS O-acetylase OafA/YrhL, contains acyltransferase and SGNH-hydrolase domains [Arthrobacter alpinus]|uniref:Peptidoglycan/LPS O-acetylase OafA/YrhL, contains acyltransferase and SGNH-hydrolase domains n=1 Tax=Arthrobacter alpinus TaxID=656366 RepID=A0A1H5E7C0_9MICC|nr:acyltransferase family protein [Arthrobacter alpinus]SED86946.1 Peptidoglycan/LPS O-acetylase OafA/YrhL, contains acyltransferase and SGNH-hydrolase domains [Arthrobacter alpinus]
MSQQATPVVHNQRLDIQGLRTLAVGLVIAYHLYPGKLPGGFVGVDIFLVISGFLIVGSLVRELAKTGTVGLGSFYARRIRRLLPASTVVLLAVVAATIVVLPQGRWQEVARDVVASALQIQNWNQAFGSASYESAGALVSPVQHFWSLAVEEQFYLVIPLLLVLAVAGGRWLKLGARTASLWFLVVLSIASLIHSVVFSLQSHDIAYFATTTRMWELGLGGILALVLPAITLSPILRFVAGWSGVAMILVSAIVFQTTMAFPGFIALVPVVGTILIIVAGSPSGSRRPAGRLGLSHCLSLRPVTYLGDISYSLYLWHWPVIVFYILIQGHEPGLAGGAVILALSLLLASLSYHQIEQRFRSAKPAPPRARSWSRPTARNRSAYALASGLVIVSCVAAAGPWAVVQIKSLQASAAEGSPDYPGAMAFDREQPAHVPDGLPISPDPAVAGKDVPLTFMDGCGSYDPGKFTDAQCWYGNPAGDKRIVLVGDSHAGQYIDPLASIANKHRWQVRALVRNGCPFSAAPPASATTTYTNCSDQNKVTLKKILAMKPERVVVAGMAPEGYRKALEWGWPSDSALVDGYVEMLRPMMDAGIQVSVVADTPYPAVSVPDCVAKKGPSSDDCQTRRNPTVDPLRAAAEKVGSVQVIDFNGYLCRNDACPPVIGNVLVFRDNHLTTTFAKTLETPLQAALHLD